MYDWKFETSILKCMWVVSYFRIKVGLVVKIMKENLVNLSFKLYIYFNVKIIKE